MNILAVDDQKMNLMSLKSLIQHFYSKDQFFTCDDPYQAIPLITKHTIDVLLLDIMMPHLSGIEILQTIRQNKAYDSIQIIMLTAMDDDETFQTCFELGANDFIKKPFSTVELKSRLNNALKTVENHHKMQGLIQGIKDHNNELRKVNKELYITRNHLVQTEKMAAVGELAAGVAHEINNPVGYISSNLETLEKYMVRLKKYVHTSQQQCAVYTDTSIASAMTSLHQDLKIDFILEDVEDLVADCRQGINKVAEIVKSMRTFAYQQNSAEKEWTSLSATIQQSILMVHNEAKYAADILFDPAEEVEVWCHQGQIGQVLVNILMNAIQAIREKDAQLRGSIHITLTKDNDHVILQIQDSGTGIQESHLPKLFNPFFTTKEVGEGTGLGLSISYDIIVNKHGGHFAASNADHGGAIFTIELPLDINADYSEV